MEQINLEMEGFENLENQFAEPASLILCLLNKIISDNRRAEYRTGTLLKPKTLQ